MKTTKFSIIVPCYNSASYVRRCIESVLNQEYKFFELIIVNDGSTDNTKEIINEYAINNSCIKVISKTNGGYVSAIRYGLENVTGDYVIFLGSDDYLNEQLLLELSKVANNEPDLILFNTYQFGEIKNGIDFYSTIKKEEYITDDDFFERITGNTNGCALLCNRDTSKAYKINNVKQINYFGNSGVDADDAFTMSYCRKFHKYYFLPFIGYYNFVHLDSVSFRNKSLTTLIDMVEVWINYFGNLNHKAQLNIFETDFLHYSLQYVSLIAKNKSNFRKKRILIKKYRKKCIWWLRKYKKLSFVTKILLYFPCLYYLFHFFKKNSK